MATRNQQRRRSSGSGAAVAFDVAVSGLAGIQELLRALPQTMRTGILKPMMEHITTVGARMARVNLVRMLPKRDPATRRWDRPTGALRDSLGHKVVPLSRMRNPNLIFGMVGARLDFRVSRQTQRRASAINRTVGRITRKTKKDTVIAPAKYIHLVERGHKGSRFYPAARGYPFMAATKSALIAILPILIREQWSVRYPRQIDSMKRRYLRRAGVTL